jgi:predicted NUDIX family NTP pyrophosphohydrolase
MKESAGTLLWRVGPEGPEVLLVHASGWYNRKAPWGIPKGEPEPEEPLEEAARRETLEETGVRAGSLRYLGSTVYRKSKKRVHCFSGEAAAEASPRCASWEVDRAEFVPLERARELIHPDQAVFLSRLSDPQSPGT